MNRPARISPLFGLAALAAVLLGTALFAAETGDSYQGLVYGQFTGIQGLMVGYQRPVLGHLAWDANAQLSGYGGAFAFGQSADSGAFIHNDYSLNLGLKVFSTGHEALQGWFLG